MLGEWTALLSWLYLDGRVQEPVEREGYRAVDTVVLIVCGFIDRMTGYAQSPMMMIVRAMYIAMMSSVV